MAMNTASSIGATIDAAACTKITTIAMAAATRIARASGEKPARIFIRASQLAS